MEPGNQELEPKSSNSSKSSNKKGSKKTYIADLLSKLSSKLGGFGRNNTNRNKNNVNHNGSLILLMMASIVIIWATSGCYSIKESDRGVVVRFGKYTHTVKPGFNWKPTFIDQVIPVNVATIREQVLKGLMLTADENLIQVDMNVPYIVTDPAQYLFNVTNPDQSLRQAIDSTVSLIIGQSTMEEVLTTKRALISDITQRALEQTIKPYNMGISILDVHFTNAHPPEEVQAAFNNEIAARDEKQQIISEAQADSYEVLQLAKVHAHKLIEEAKAYKSSIILKAEGEVASLAKLLPEYLATPQITIERLYITTMERVLSNLRKIIVNNKSDLKLLFEPILKNGNNITKKITTPQTNDFSHHGMLDHKSGNQQSTGVGNK